MSSYHSRGVVRKGRMTERRRTLRRRARRAVRGTSDPQTLQANVGSPRLSPAVHPTAKARTFDKLPSGMVDACQKATRLREMIGWGLTWR